MRHNADFSARAAVHSDDAPWVDSPMPGVQRQLLDRIGEEVARATSMVRYAPGSAFSAHTHAAGEEFIVLEGVFSDEHGDYPVGSYVRNPPGSSHTPSSAPGCVIFVKLRQFDPADLTEVRASLSEPGLLHRFGHEEVRVERWSAGQTVERTAAGGLEVLVLAGGFTEAGESFRPGSWLRLPPGATLSAAAGTAGAHVWVKEGHLLDAAR